MTYLTPTCLDTCPRIPYYLGMTNTDAPIRNIFIDGRFAYTTRRSLKEILDWHEGMHRLHDISDGTIYLHTI